MFRSTECGAGHGQALGTAIYLYGTANCSYSVVLDDQLHEEQADISSDLLFWQNNLSSGSHSVMLTANPEVGTTQQVAFNKAVFTNIGVNSR